MNLDVGSLVIGVCIGAMVALFGVYWMWFRIPR